MVSLDIQRVLLGLQQGELYPWALLAHYYYYIIGGEGRCLSSALVLRDTLTPCRAARKHTIVGKSPCENTTESDPSLHAFQASKEIVVM